MRGIGWLLMVAMLLATGLLMTGCGSKKTEPATQPQVEQQAPEPAAEEEPAVEEEPEKESATEQPAKGEPAEEPAKEEPAPAGPPTQPSGHEALGDNCIGCHSSTLPASHPQENCAGCHQPSS
jgi:outer membrane biosynthesis protein TonB